MLRAAANPERQRCLHAAPADVEGTTHPTRRMSRRIWHPVRHHAVRRRSHKRIVSRKATARLAEPRGLEVDVA